MMSRRILAGRFARPAARHIPLRTPISQVRCLSQGELDDPGMVRYIYQLYVLIFHPLTWGVFLRTITIPTRRPRRDNSAIRMATGGISRKGGTLESQYTRIMIYWVYSARRSIPIISLARAFSSSDAGSQPFSVCVVW